MNIDEIVELKENIYTVKDLFEAEVDSFEGGPVHSKILADMKKASADLDKIYDYWEKFSNKKKLSWSLETEELAYQHYEYYLRLELGDLVFQKFSLEKARESVVRHLHDNKPKSDDSISSEQRVSTQFWINKIDQIVKKEQAVLKAKDKAYEKLEEWRKYCENS